MKKLIIVFLSVLFVVQFSAAQNFEAVLGEIEKNNTELMALKKAGEAEMLENKTGVFLQNPEFEFHYLWGSPAMMGQRADISITQSFDFPSVYHYQSKISDIKNEQVSLNYMKEFKGVMLKAKQILNELVYYNALKKQTEERLEHANSIALSYQTKFDIGETNILEYNKSQLNLLNLSKEKESVEIERQVLLAKLRELNGGKQVSFEESQYNPELLADDFDKWYEIAEQNNPILNWLKQELEKSQADIKLAKAKTLPAFNAGYMNENVGGDSFQGLVLGLSIPLWANKNTVKHAKASSVAIESYNTDRKLEFYNHLKGLYNKAKSLNALTLDYKLQLEKYNHSALLNKALDKGQITLIDYMMELSIYYESENRLLELQKDFKQTIAELNQFAK